MMFFSTVLCLSSGLSTLEYYGLNWFARIKMCIIVVYVTVLGCNSYMKNLRVGSPSVAEPTT